MMAIMKIVKLTILVVYYMIYYNVPQCTEIYYNIL